MISFCYMHIFTRKPRENDDSLSVDINIIGPVNGLKHNYVGRANFSANKPCFVCKIFCICTHCVWVFFSTVLTALEIHVLYCKTSQLYNFSKRLGGVICLSTETCTSPIPGVPSHHPSTPPPPPLQAYFKSCVPTLMHMSSTRETPICPGILGDGLDSLPLGRGN